MVSGIKKVLSDKTPQVKKPLVKAMMLSISLLGLSFLQADDIDLYLQGVVVAGDETFDGGNQSAMTFLLDSSGSMSFAIDSVLSDAVSYATGSEFYNDGERRTIMKNAFIDYVSSAPSDLKIGMYDYGGQRVTTDLLTRLYDDQSEVITYEGDDDADAPLSFVRQPNATGQFRCDDEDETIHCDTGDPDYEYDNDDSFYFWTSRIVLSSYVRAGYASFELPSGSAYEGKNIDRIYLSDIRRQTGENIELIVKVYDDMTTSESDANGEEVFNVAAPSMREITRFEVNLRDSIYEFDADAISDIADDLSDGNYSDLQFIIVPKNPRTGGSTAYINLDNDDLRLNIEYSEEDEDEEAEADGVVTSAVMTIGSDVVEDNSGDVFDLNRTDVSGGQDMKELSLSGNSKVAFRFMLLPFDSSNTSFIDDIQFRVYPSGTIGSNVTVSIGLTNDSEVIPVEPGALTVLYDSATKADVTIDSGDWNSAVTSGDGYEISLPDTLKNAIISRMSSATSWDYQDAITLVLDRVSGTSNLGFYSYEESHEPSATGICPPGSESYVLSSYAGNQTFCDYGTAAKLEFSLYNSASVYNLMKRSHREQVILSAMTFGSSGGTPISPRYIDIAQYYQGGSSPLEDTGSKECGIPDAIVMLTDGQETTDTSDDPRSDFQNFFTPGSAADFTCSRGSQTNPNPQAHEYWNCSNQLAEGLAMAQGGGVTIDGQDYTVRSYGILFGPAAETPETDPSYPDTAYDYLTEFARAAETTNEDGKAYAAQSGYELVKVFKAIEGSVTFQSVSAFTPNVSPGSASSFESSDELYYPLFEPQSSLRWSGNLKRYSFWDLDSSPERSDFQVVDVNMQSVYNDALASDTFTIIKDSARSWWSNAVDGADVASGGAAGETAAANRNVYTFIPGVASKQNQEIVNNSLSNDIADAYWFEQSPQALTGVEKQNLVDYADTLWGPVIHNLPMLVNQKRTFDSDAYLTGSINTVYVGDNTGFLRAVNAGEPTSSTVTTNLGNTGGNEFWAFMPVELIPNIYRLNAEATEAGDVNPNYHNRYVYGVDGEITVLGADYNRDGDFLDTTEVTRSYKDASGGISTETVTLDDTMNIYFGLRRGGSAYYGLNVADTYAGGSQNPKLLFRLYNTYTTTVQGNALIGDVRNIQLDRLAETWSPMEKAKLRLNGEIKNVLIFGGGYDSDQNEAIDSDIINYDVINTPQLGNAVYIVDAETGELLSYISGVVTDTSKGVSSVDMNYSIPGRIAVVDLGGDGVDLLYATDTGGQVFRIEIDSGAGSYDTDGDGAVDTNIDIVSSVTTIAKLGRSVATTDEDNRYFFSGPVASFVKQGDMKDDLALVISSGFVPQLGNATVQDYIITLFEKDVYIKGAPAVATPYTLDNFVTIDPDSAALEYENNTLLSTISTTDGLVGWKLPLNKSNAEKVTGEPKLVKERLFLTTFSIDNPDQQDQCSVAVGQSNSYAMYLDATAIYSSGRVINTSAGFSTTGSVIKNVRDSNDTYFLFGTQAVCLEGNCNQTLQLDTPPTPEPENFFTDTESLIRSKWRQCIDSDFIDCGSNIGVGAP